MKIFKLEINNLRIQNNIFAYFSGKNDVISPKNPRN